MPSAHSKTKFNVIIVDDDQLVRDFAVHAVEYGTNQKVVTFDSGFKAWQFIQEAPKEAGIIIADANIPDMNGLELLTRVKQIHPEVIFVITTSNPNLEPRASQSGADAFLSKPYDIKDLFAVLQQFFSPNTPTKQNSVANFPNTEGSR
jgi:CheY-like chemotaxis protein